MATAIFSTCSSSTSTDRLPKLETIRRSGSVRLRPTPAFLSFKPRHPAGFGASISMQRPSYNSSITAVAMSTRTRFPSVVLDGKAVAEEIGDEITYEVKRMRVATGITPMLAVIIVGNKNHSPVHLENKFKACKAAGIKTNVVRLSEDSSEEEVLDRISRFNKESSVHGIHIQLPLPRHMDKEKILRAVRAEKDVDGEVCYEEAYEWASVPGGVESMTTAMLLSNTLRLVKRALNFD